MRIERDDDGVIISIELSAPDDARALAGALDQLLEATRDLRGLLGVEGWRSPRWMCQAGFVTPCGALDEREFFERCAAHPTLHPAMLRYVAQLTEGARGLSFGVVDGLLHDDDHPAGSFAIVPLALADRRYLGALIEHLRGVDLAHESFHAVLIDRLLTIHGLCDETFALLVFRAADGAGGGGHDNLWLAVHAHGLRDHWQAWGGLEGFIERLHRDSESLSDDTEDIGLLVHQLLELGRALGLGDRVGLAHWLEACAARWDVDFASEYDPDYDISDGRVPTTRMTAYSEDEWQAAWLVPADAIDPSSRDH